ncbi:AAA family ATPase [Alsobacter sp. SYSU M60028]|uniref:AAA family ATPase n=1 Tax=Alsobacter ponti TaxID=2962936 RepID=A0ABT1LAK4_9HYPH|nr:AAA family ATPase [Alsobacter ponti]MCP8938512.1 AAA family ATPase [Alsobacter ponti]
MRSRVKKTAALAYAEAGHPILALFGVTEGACDCGTPNCPSAGKHPMTRYFPHGFKHATTNVDAIERIWTKHPNANIGLVPTRDLLIVDIDGPKGEASVAALDLPETLSQRTGKGRHAVFTCEGLSGWKAPKLEGVDFRYNANGYIAVSPSTHVSGRSYRWRSGHDRPAKLDHRIFKAPRLLRIDFGATTDTIKEGGRNTRLASIAGALRAKGVPEKAIAESLARINREVCDPPLPPHEVRKIAKSIGSYPTPSEEAFGDLADVKVEEVAWLLRPYFPRGVASVIEGDPGIGKSNFTMALIAALTTGRGVPWSPDTPRGVVLILSAEDDPARVLKPRLIANGADLSHGRVWFAQELFTLDETGLDLLRQKIAEVEPALVVIDPLVAYMGAGADVHKATDMTQFFVGLSRIARENDCAIMVVRHLRKSRQGDALMQGHGSVSIIGSVRSALVMARHPDDAEVRAVAHSKSNYGPLGPTLTFTLVATGSVPAVKWLGTDENLTSDRLLQPAPGQGPGRPTREGDDVRAFLSAYLASGGRDSRAVRTAAEARSFAWITVRRVAKDLGVLMIREGLASIWSLPPKAAP